LYGAVLLQHVQPRRRPNGRPRHEVQGMVRRCVWLVVAMALVFAPAALAQTVAQLSGTVTDESGGVLPGATVTVTQTGTGQSRFVVTGSQGEYVFTNLA